MSVSDRRRRVYRVDKFKVPDGARAEFLARVRETHGILRAQPGFVEDYLLEQTGGPRAFNVVTFMAWKDATAVEQAGAVIAEHRRESGFNPQELLARLGIESDVANYAEVREA